jgi:hypothetical protein
MKRSTIVAHLGVPALVTFAVFAVALGRETFGAEMLAAYLLEGYLFYAAPYLLWAIVAGLAGFTNALWHAGFIASSIALVAISMFWLFPGDPSGLPIQWMLYWPLAIILQILAAGLTAIYKRAHARNASINTDAAQ